MTATVFVDTNVLVYARDRTDVGKHRRAAAWMASLWSTRAGRLSWQVLHEYYVTVTRKLSRPRPRADARDDVAALVTWRPVPMGVAVLDRAWTLEDEVGLSWWDALIVGAALEASCTHLLTEDLQDERVLDGLTIVSPFTSAPEDVLGA